MTPRPHPWLPIVTWALLCLLALGLAQGGQTQTAQPVQGLVEGQIAYGQLVEETIDSTYTYDVWQFSGQAGDQLRAIMVASDGLMPLIGIRDSSGAVVVRSDDGTANGTVEISYTLPTSGLYALIPTRAGLSQGTSTGSYRLALQWLNAPTPTPANGPVSFRCGPDEATALASLAWSPPEVELNAAYRPVYRVRLYGFDGLRPVLRVSGAQADSGCYGAGDAGAQPLLGDALTLPGGERAQAGEYDFTFTLSPLPTEAAGGAAMPSVELTFGAAAGAGGRYLVVVEPFAIEPADDDDSFRLLNAPLAAATPLDLYLIAIGANNRLDPVAALVSDAGDMLVCDDAGRRPCADLPSAYDLVITSADGASIAGSRFSAGLRLPPGELGWHTISARSFSGNTRGSYALVLAGTLPE